MSQSQLLALPLPPQVSRSDLTQKRYQSYTKRLQNYYGSLLSALKANAQPDLLTFIEPPKEALYGYQILPKILDETPAHEQRSRMVGYSWPWTDKLIDDANQEIDQSEAELAGSRESTQPVRRQIYEKLARRYLQLHNRMKNIDAHIQYNRLWQTEVAANRATYDRATTLYALVLERDTIHDLLNSLPAIAGLTDDPLTAFQDIPFMGDGFRQRESLLAQTIDAATTRVDVPDFIRFERRPGLRIFHVPIYTDIDDRDFLRSLKDKIEAIWRLRAGGDEFRVEVELLLIPTSRLYNQEATPKPGVKINLERHLALFPRDGAILTTGALTTHVSGRAILLGTQDISGHVLAHEFGHILGFRDSYIRGYKDLGKDGFQIMEVVAEPNDIMGSPDNGTILPSHFRKMSEQLSKNSTATTSVK